MSDSGPDQVPTAGGDVRAVRVHGAGDLRVDTVPPPVAYLDRAVIRVRYGGICGSDIHYWRDGAGGASVLRAPITLGHEIVCTVAVAAPDGSGAFHGPGRGG